MKDKPAEESRVHLFDKSEGSNLKQYGGSFEGWSREGCFHESHPCFMQSFTNDCADYKGALQNYTMTLRMP